MTGSQAIAEAVAVSGLSLDAFAPMIGVSRTQLCGWVAQARADHEGKPWMGHVRRPNSDAVRCAVAVADECVAAAAASVARLKKLIGDGQL